MKFKEIRRKGREWDKHKNNGRMYTFRFSGRRISKAFARLDGTQYTP